MRALLAALVLSQTASNTMIVDPTFQSNKVTTTPVATKRGLDVNCIGGCSGGGGSSTNQGQSNDGGFNWHVDVGQWGGVNTTLGQKAMTASVPVTFASDQSPLACTQSGTWNVNSIQSGAWTVSALVSDSSGNGIESAITEVVGTNRGLLVREVVKTLTAPVVTSVSCGTTSTALPTTAGRKSICIENEGVGDIYIGPTGVTTGTGLPIATGATWCDDVGSQAYFCINAVGTNDVRVLEN
jgi:hypothetical protein